MRTLPTAEQIAAKAASWRWDAQSDLLYALCIFMAGDYQALNKWVESRGTPTREVDEVAPMYPDIKLNFGAQGTNNHALVNSRIINQSVVYAEPVFTFLSDDPLIREINQQWVATRWEEGEFNEEFMQAAMEVEATGVSWVQFGIDGGAASCVHRSVFDVLWPTTIRSPAKWREGLVRVTLSPDDATERYFEAISNAYKNDDGTPWSEDQVHAWFEEQARALPEWDYGSEISSAGSDQPMRAVITWEYWSTEAHCVFLGSCFSECPMLRYSKELRYELVPPGDRRAGPNPLMVFPLVPWIDSWSPKVRRPVSRTFTSARIASMLNRLEFYARYIVENGLPVNLVNVDALTEEQRAKFTNHEGDNPIQLLETLLVEGDRVSLDGVLHRVPAADIPQAVTELIRYYKEELNSSTGVVDAMRGKSLPGRKTKYEAQTVFEAGGVQAKHTQKQYERFLRNAVIVMRAIGAMYDSRPVQLSLSSGVLDSARFPLAPFLAMPLMVQIDETSLQYESPEAKRERRLAQFDRVDQAGIAAGVVDPLRVFQDLYKVLGYRDPSELMFTPEQMREQALLRTLEGLSAGQPAGGGEPVKESA